MDNGGRLPEGFRSHTRTAWNMKDQIEIGDSIPRWPSRFRLLVGWTILRLSGWRIHAHIPDLPRMVVIAAPHTSNWDFVFGMAAIFRLQVKINFIGKHTLFEGWKGRFFRALGGYPVDRTAPGGVVQETVNTFASNERMILALAPEGTRARREQWKRGFYHIACAAKVPVLVAYIDYSRKQVGTQMLMQPSGDWDADMKPVFEFYRSVGARKPENFAVEN